MYAMHECMNNINGANVARDCYKQQKLNSTMLVSDWVII